MLLPQCEWCGEAYAYCTHLIDGIIDGEHVHREVCYRCGASLVAVWPSLAMLPMPAEDYRRHGLPVADDHEEVRA